MTKIREILIENFASSPQDFHHFALDDQLDQAEAQIKKLIKSKLPKKKEIVLEQGHKILQEQNIGFNQAIKEMKKTIDEI